MEGKVKNKKMLKQTINKSNADIHTLEAIPENNTIYLEYKNSSTSVSVKRFDNDEIHIVIYNAKNEVDIKISKDDLEKIKLGVF